MRRHSQSCGLVARVSFYCLLRGSGRLIKSNVAPKLCDHWHNFICSPVADGSKNNCDFAGFDLNGDLHNKSSHAPVKTAIIILLSFRFPTCITSQVKLCGNLGIDSCFIFTAVPCIFEIVILTTLFEPELIVFYKLPISGFSFSLS